MESSPVYLTAFWFVYRSVQISFCSSITTNLIEGLKTSSAFHSKYQNTPMLRMTVSVCPSKHAAFPLFSHSLLSLIHI